LPPLNGFDRNCVLLELTFTLSNESSFTSGSLVKLPNPIYGVLFPRAAAAVSFCELPPKTVVRVTAVCDGAGGHS
jgi:hypothetical protein